MGVDLSGFASLLLVIGIAWLLFWKGWSLWIAARKGSKVWFIALLVLNTMGILEILYVFFFSKRDGLQNKQEKIEHDNESEAQSKSESESANEDGDSKEDDSEENK